MHAIVAADGEPAGRTELDAAWPGWDRGVELVVAADGGARLVANLGLRLDAWVGDGDSLDRDALDALERARIPTLRVAADKDESDTELAIVEAIRRGADELTILGALGGRRLDHALANVGLLAHPTLDGRPARLLDQRTRVRLLAADGPSAASRRLDLGGRVGDLVSLLPWGGPVAGVTTHGLRYPLRDEALVPGPARGLSNVRDDAGAWVEARDGRLLVVESPATLRP